VEAEAPPSVLSGPTVACLPPSPAYEFRVPARAPAVVLDIRRRLTPETERVDRQRNAIKDPAHRFGQAERVACRPFLAPTPSWGRSPLGEADCPRHMDEAIAARGPQPAA